jgi:hypothetical protein
MLMTGDAGPEPIRTETIRMLLVHGGTVLVLRSKERAVRDPGPLSDGRRVS